jgi:hypothetical protein
VDREEAYHRLWDEVYRPLAARAPGDKHLDLMAQELGLHRVTVGDVLRAREARKALGEGAPDLSTQDAAVLAPLARADAGSARVLALARARGRLTADELAKLAPRIRSMEAEQRTAALGRFLGPRPRTRVALPRPSPGPKEPPLRQLGQILRAVREFQASAPIGSFRDDELLQAMEMILEIQRQLENQLHDLRQAAGRRGCG